MSKITQKVLQFFYVQLFVSLISLSILLCWGLPISLMTIVGNFLFAPFLTVFLSLSVLFFFTELFHLPNHFIAQALEFFSLVWSWCMHWGSSSWLMSFAQPPYLILLLIPCVAVIIVHVKNATRAQQVVALAVLTLITCSYLFFLCRPTSYCAPLGCNDGAIFIAHHNKQTVVIDPGFIACRGNAASWLEHDLLKELTKHLGSTTIHHLVLLQPSPRLFEAVAQLCRLTTVEKIYLPRWQGTFNKKQWGHFFEMREAIEDTNGVFIPIATSMIISLDQGSYVSIALQEKMIKAPPITYPVIHVRGRIGAEKIITASIKAFKK
jgi:hypothetical protein